MVPSRPRRTRGSGPCRHRGRGGAVTVNHVSLLRDMYYIAAKDGRPITECLSELVRPSRPIAGRIPRTRRLAFARSQLPFAVGHDASEPVDFVLGLINSSCWRQQPVQPGRPALGEPGHSRPANTSSIASCWSARHCSSTGRIRSTGSRESACRSHFSRIFPTWVLSDERSADTLMINHRARSRIVHRF